MAERTNNGLIQVYTGDGKGKTTAALGLAIRAAGHGMRVGFIQFLKGTPSGEHLFMLRYHAFDIIQIGAGSGFTKSREQLSEEAQRTLAYAKVQMLSGRYDLLILDEVFVAIHKGLVTTKQVLDLLNEKPESVELVLTGRHAPPEIVRQADLATDVRKVKHPFDKGIRARVGIEY
ncbi:MAG: cob(I)yrinic acid a,c-diamide adenosyltransferase [Chloroflexi bacterium]|nr:cob(I)yrinic acid a,c-diamide adenosyltransferase [Chloroflexota bacterium]